MNSSLDCNICFLPSEGSTVCLQCGIIFCSKCLQNCYHPQPIECIQCSGKNFGPLPDFLIQENQEAQVPMITPGQQSPQRINKNCVNYSICKQQVDAAFEEDEVCSPECLMFLLIADLHSQKKFNEVKKQIDKGFSKIKNKPNKVQIRNPIFSSDLGVTQFRFTLAGKNITVNDDQVVLSEDQYVFRSILSDTGFNKGSHYWEISPLSLTENEMKIGVSKNNKASMDQGFCDQSTGWAYYTVGQLRHGSNSQGTPYGVKMKNKGTIGVCLNMTDGTLSFSCDGQFLGIAYEGDELKQGPIYPAVAMLHKAGFSYKSNIGAPTCFKLQHK